MRADLLRSADLPDHRNGRAHHHVGGGAFDEMQNGRLSGEQAAPRRDDNCCNAGDSRRRDEYRRGIQPIPHRERRGDPFATARRDVARRLDGTDIQHRQLRRRIDKPRRDDLAHCVYALRIGGNGDVRTDGSDPAVTDQHYAALNRRAAHRVHSPAGNGDRLRAQRCGDEQRDQQRSRHARHQ